MPASDRAKVRRLRATRREEDVHERDVLRGHNVAVFEIPHLGEEPAGCAICCFKYTGENDGGQHLSHWLRRATISSYWGVFCERP
jgi:hypothetical protein